MSGTDNANGDASCGDIFPGTEGKRLQETMSGNSRVQLEKAQISKRERPDHTGRSQESCQRSGEEKYRKTKEASEMKILSCFEEDYAL